MSNDQLAALDVALAEIDDEIAAKQAARAEADAAARAGVVALKRERDGLVAQRDALRKVAGLSPAERAALSTAIAEADALEPAVDDEAKG